MTTKISSTIYVLIFSIVFSLGIFCTGCSEKKAEEELHIFLCFGQSNMEGNAKAEAQDSIGVDERFMVLQAVDCDSARVKGQWRTAIPPLVRCHTGLSPADYFGRTMVANLPENIKVGIINVSVGGCRIELFDKDNYESYVETSPDWLKNMVKEYDGNPYQRLVDLANQAQAEGGIIKGILLHQGESNSGEQDWPQKVKIVYNNLLKDINLEANSIPLLAGELVNTDQNGACAGMNEIIRTLPDVIPNTYVIPSDSCKGIEDRLHFSAEGYRELGKRYAKQMLSLYKVDNTK
ncbi:hypothetical protein M2451_002299 [Dysgonomonas sp. PFB1-18]|nr:MULTISPECIES: sialate O-acetylesterase [unclassified Dysgonomonas]MDH6309927.1 hypothetical protein [Dysgonomonas sp. PF1-14]MDH6339470.1 hypothetical protein [Dysgonomonas sp. PF1-16]MDH6380971.1 hypothetical protein [Dysgonomonas sp. PFB1-18]MDH6397980.1 hypothetical protein [Dysgonomonas sp. PF1-23]